MSELEQLRAHFQQSRSAEHGQAYLAKAVAEGSLPHDRIKLAAYLGEPGAIAHLGGRVPPASDDLREWLSGLGVYGHEAAVRAALAVARNTIRGKDTKPSAGRAVQTAREWVLERTEDALKRCVNAAQHAFASAYGDSDESDQLRELVHDTAVSVDSVALACCYAAQAVCEPTPERAAAIASLTAFTSSDTSEEQLRAWVREDLVRWALDLGDPLRD
ncbi:MAG: hypothetical protein KDD82_19635 [Planctomycetes bacterium]|nr:hypothetical protein [Planctomycetota bacterium]